jgi:hypothetical protein
MIVMAPVNLKGASLKDSLGSFAFISADAAADVALPGRVWP